MPNIANPDDSFKVYRDLFGTPPLARRQHAASPVPHTSGCLRTVEPFKHDKGYFVRATVDLGVIVVPNVIASMAGVAWPMHSGELLFYFVDDDLRERAERALMKAARATNIEGRRAA